MQSLGFILLEAIAELDAFVISVGVTVVYCPLDFWNIQR